MNADEMGCRREKEEQTMNHSRIADLTVAEFKELVRQTLAQSFAELLGDPDEGLVLRDDIAEELRRSLAEVGAGGQTLSLSEVAGRVESTE